MSEHRDYEDEELEEEEGLEETQDEFNERVMFRKALLGQAAGEGDYYDFID